MNKEMANKLLVKTAYIIVNKDVQWSKDHWPPDCSGFFYQPKRPCKKSKKC